jgi:hypothetical protein
LSRTLGLSEGFGKQDRIYCFEYFESMKSEMFSATSHCESSIYKLFSEQIREKCGVEEEGVGFIPVYFT